jgi:hypothetical protein
VTVEAAGPAAAAALGAREAAALQRVAERKGRLCALYGRPAAAAAAAIAGWSAGVQQLAMHWETSQLGETAQQHNTAALVRLLAVTVVCCSIEAGLYAGN